MNTPEFENNIGTTIAVAPKSHPKPRKKAKVKVKAKVKSKPHVKSKGKAKPGKATGKGKFKRLCALQTCRKPFRTDDKRKIYHSRACGNKQRSQRWYEAAAAALRKLRKHKAR